jgi:WhiB family redox-sensing transcriptional regulator
MNAGLTATARVEAEAIDGDRSWRGMAACLAYDPELFYPVAGAMDTPAARRAVQICTGCPVRRECLAEALARRERHGIWGGTSPEQRSAMLRSARQLARATA